MVEVLFYLLITWMNCWSNNQMPVHWEALMTIWRHCVTKSNHSDAWFLKKCSKKKFTLITQGVIVTAKSLNGSFYPVYINQQPHYTIKLYAHYLTYWSSPIMRAFAWIGLWCTHITQDRTRLEDIVSKCAPCIPLHFAFNNSSSYFANGE